MLTWPVIFAFLAWCVHIDTAVRNNELSAEKVVQLAGLIPLGMALFSAWMYYNFYWDRIRKLIKYYGLRRSVMI